MWTRVYLAVLGLAFLLIGCVEINIFSRDEEVRLGWQLSQEVKRQYPILKHPELTGYVNQVGQRIVAVCDWRDIEYHFTVIDDPKQINAFALPGGYIYVYTGLLRTAESEAELAAVLAHEVGHVVARHATKRLTKLYGYSFLMSLILGENPAQWQRIIADLFGTMGILKFSRDDEFEADRLGATYLYRAGYDPWAMLTFLQKLQGLEKQEPGRLKTLLSTHPPTRDRIRRVEELIRGWPRLRDPGPIRNDTGD